MPGNLSGEGEQRRFVRYNSWKVKHFCRKQRTGKRERECEM